MSIDWVKDAVIPFASAISGAIVGAAASYLASSRLAKQASDEVLERDKIARRDQDKRAAHQVFVKLHVITNSLASYHKQIIEMVEKADGDGNGHMRLYQRLSTFPGIEREPSIEFSAEELTIYIAAKRADYVNDLLLLARRYAACLVSLETFAKLKIELHYKTARLGRTTRNRETGVSSTTMRSPPEIANYMMVKADELEIFAKGMCDQLAEYNAFASNVADRFEEVTRGFLDGAIPGFLIEKTTG
ncbi:MAG TPA: hypothetical protein VGF77_02225 [Allosphingosinicella sp.]|jgi:hypothetical protein